MYVNFYDWLGNCMFSIKVSSDQEARTVAIRIFQNDYTTVVDWTVTSFPCGEVL